jgi:hypothetical protein
MKSNAKLKRIKIVTPGMKGFEKVLKSKTTAFGNCHEENEIRAGRLPKQPSKD